MNNPIITTPLTDANAFYGRYIKKDEKAAPLTLCRDIERWYYEEKTKHRIAQAQVDRIHIMLDHLNIPRVREDTKFTMSLEERMRYFISLKK